MYILVLKTFQFEFLKYFSEKDNDSCQKKEKWTMWYVRMFIDHIFDNNSVGYHRWYGCIMSHFSRPLFLLGYLARFAFRGVLTLWTVERLSGENVSPLKVYFTIGKIHFERWLKKPKTIIFGYCSKCILPIVKYTLSSELSLRFWFF